VTDLSALIVSQSLKGHIATFMEGIQCRMPSDSFIKLVLAPAGEKKLIRGLLSVRSENLNFEVECNDNEILGILCGLRLLSQSEVKVWHSERVFAS
jgi:hypothetical protein